MLVLHKATYAIASPFKSHAPRTAPSSDGSHRSVWGATTADLLLHLAAVPVETISCSAILDEDDSHLGPSRHQEGHVVVELL